MQKTDYTTQIEQALDKIRDEGRYRTFHDVCRISTDFPRAWWQDANGQRKQITIWCSNDYLGMGATSYGSGRYAYRAGYGGCWLWRDA